MKQFGDITKLDGAKLEPVDLIVGGSPCQDLSVAGKREGLAGERSGLFMEMIRVIKEMRNATNFIRPRWILWENVPGAFSSNDGLDFQAVLTELCRIAEPGTPDVPMPEEGWTKAGVLLGPDWSIAWRTHDAQYWGVPQRRRRIALVMDLRGQSAPEILFERKSVQGNSEQSEAEQEGITGQAQDGTGTTGVSLVRERNNQAVFDPSVHHEYREFDDVSETVRSRYGTGGNDTPMVLEGEVKYWDGTDVVGTLSVRNAGGAQRMPDKDNFNGLTDGRSVRRLTPLECERLQGFPDGWTDIPGTSDAKRYKALGNSIALPFWEHLAKRFVSMGEVQTIGSLFDGIGGFPLVFQRAGAETLWTSEIEPFCEQVVKIRFGGEA